MNMMSIPLARETVEGLRMYGIEYTADDGLLRRLINEIEHLGRSVDGLLSFVARPGEEISWRASATMLSQSTRIEISAKSNLSPEDALAKLLLQLRQLNLIS